MHPSISLPITLSIYLSFHPSIHSLTAVSIHLPIRPIIPHFYPSIHLSYQSLHHTSIHPPLIYPSMNHSFRHLSTTLSFYHFTRRSFHQLLLSIHPSNNLCIHPFSTIITHTLVSHDIRPSIHHFSHPFISLYRTAIHPSLFPGTLSSPHSRRLE